MIGPTNDHGRTDLTPKGARAFAQRAPRIRLAVDRRAVDLLEADHDVALVLATSPEDHLAVARAQED